MSTANGVVYAVAKNGDLQWYHHDGRLTGEFRWKGPHKVGAGWGEVARVFGADDGVLYTVGRTTQPPLEPGKQQPAAHGGDLTWWRHTGRGDGTFSWEGPKRVGKEWGHFVSVFAGPDGVLYAIQPGGDLIWYRHTGRHEGSFAWEGPHTVGNGWANFQHVFCGPDGIIYAVRPNVQPLVRPNEPTPPPSGGELMWYRHVGQLDGSNRWEGPPRTVGTGWADFTAVFSGGDDIIYGVRPMADQDVPIDRPAPPPSGGDLSWYRHLGQSAGTNSWDGPKKVGTHWNTFTSTTSGRSEPRLTAEGAIGDYWRDTLSVMSVGMPTGPARPADAGAHVQEFNFGTITKPLGETPVIGTRYAIAVEIAAIVCYATDDPGGTDEPYAIATTYTLDRSVQESVVRSVHISNDVLGDHKAGDVFGQNQQLANGIFVPGDGDIRVHISLWDEELGINPEKMTERISDAVETGITTGFPVVAAAVGGVFGGPPGAAAGFGVGTALAVALGATGISEEIGDAVGAAVVDMLGDDLIDQKDFVLDAQYLHTLCKGDAATLERHSQAAGAPAYNFPQGPEDDTWLFNRGDGKGTYRVLLRVTNLTP